MMQAMKHLPNLLIVDDSEENLLFLETVTGKIKVNLIKAFSGFEALEKTHGIELALAIIDIRMPGMNGYELSLKLNEERSGDKVPVIFLTASHINEEDVFKGYGSGAVDYILKPVDSHILLCKINVFLDLFNQKQTIIRDAALLKKSADELTRVNAAIKKSEEEHKSYIVNAPDGIFVTDETGKYVEVNDAACRITGYSKDELVRMSISDMLPEESLIEGKAHFNKVVQTGTSKSDMLFRHKNGSKRWWTVDAVKLSETRFFAFTKDITERKQAEEALRKSEEKLRGIFESIGDAVTVSDLEGNIIDINEAAISLWGYAGKEELIGRKGAEFIVEEPHPIAVQRVEEVLIEENTKNAVEFNFVRKDGSMFSGEARSASLLDSSGEPAGFISVVTDITERKRAENLLAQTRQNYETFFNTIDEFLFVLDEQGNLIHINNTIIDCLGYSQSELLGKSVLMLYPPERRNEVASIVDEMFSGVTWFCPVPIITKSGVQIPVETRVSHGFWDGKPVIFGVSKDISKIKLSEEKFSKLFYINPSACGLSDLENNIYIEVNEAFYTLLGFDKEEVIGKSALEIGILTPETINAISLKTESNGNVTNAEADLTAKNGDIKHVLLSSENIYVQDKKFRFTVIHDITERKEMQEKVLASEKLAVMGRLVADVAHEINNPLAIIISRTQLMLSQVDKQSLPFKGPLEIVLKSARRCKTILSNLLSYSRTIGKEEDAVNLPDLIREAIDNVNYQYDMGTIDVELNFNLPPNTEIAGNKVALLSVFVNLIRNARQAMPEKGTLSITGEKENESQIRIEIHDTGIGITINQMRKLFQPFISGWKENDGTGLGLATSLGIIETHGGKMFAESDGLGKGTKFTILLPYKLKEVEINQTVDKLEE